MELGDLVQGDLVQGDLILSLFTDMSNSSSSLSTEERHSNTPGSVSINEGGGETDKPKHINTYNRKLLF